MKYQEFWEVSGILDSSRVRTPEVNVCLILPMGVSLYFISASVQSNSKDLWNEHRFSSQRVCHGLSACVDEITL